jgi:hypothetical protein
MKQHISPGPTQSRLSRAATGSIPFFASIAPVFARSPRSAWPAMNGSDGARKSGSIVAACAESTNTSPPRSSGTPCMAPRATGARPT